jgi:hypothetical protein
LAVGLLDPYLAGGPRSPWDPTAMAVLAGWGVLGAIVAVRLFRWAPQDL